jgi:DNA repair protein RadA/Sms
MVAKTKFVCTSCGYESGKWYGRCPECGTWNSFQEVTVPGKRAASGQEFIEKDAKPKKLSSIQSSQKDRFSTGLLEFDRVLGGDPSAGSGREMGVVPGSVMLLSGDPGIGKSTVLLQIALLLSSKKSVLYVSGEESESQIKMRAERLDGVRAKKADNLTILATTNVDTAVDVIERELPGFVIIDSIQTIGSLELPGLPGSIPQVRNSTAKLVTLAKKNHIPVCLVGHVTKEGTVAGPQLLSHMVDTVLYLEGDTVTGTSRPLLIEVQALVVPSTLSFPRRVTNGIPDRRLELLLAVIQKHARVPLERMDIFVNIVGGLRITEPAVDLAVCLAVLSSYKQGMHLPNGGSKQSLHFSQSSKSKGKPIQFEVAIGEVGLLGEIKSVVQLDKRIREAEKFGFKKIATVEKIRSIADLVSKYA